MFENFRYIFNMSNDAQIHVSRRVCALFSSPPVTTLRLKIMQITRPLDLIISGLRRESFLVQKPKSQAISAIKHLWDHLGRKAKEQNDVNYVIHIGRYQMPEWIPMSTLITRRC